MPIASNSEEGMNREAETRPSSPLNPEHTRKWLRTSISTMISELKMQKGIVLPLMVMNLTWFGKLAITTAFLGRQGELQLAGSALGLAFANVTGFSVLSGLCCAMEPICGQAYGAKNFKLLHKTLLMSIFFLLSASVPISFLWLNVDRILVHFGQRQDIAIVAKTYLIYLLPYLGVSSLLYPLKAYLSSQGITVPVMFSSAVSLAVHVPINILLAEVKGVEGIAMALWITDLIVVILLTVYILVTETGKNGKWKEGGWWDQGAQDWLKLLKLSGPCCLTTCLEWWCYEILVLLTGRLPNAVQAVGILVIVLNFDYLLYAVMISLATCASIRVSNELGANNPTFAYRAAYTSLAVGMISGIFGAAATLGARAVWGPLYSHDKEIIQGVKKMMLIMAAIEVVNFPLSACGGIVRGTARPWLAIYANTSGFYLLALPLGVVLAFKAKLGLGGLLLGFVAGITICFLLLLVLVGRIHWRNEAAKAQRLTCSTCETEQDANQKDLQKEACLS